MEKDFWKGKKVFITGHTGFKGSWLCIWLHSLGAHVTGYALEPPTEPSMFDLCGIDRLVDSVIGDVRNVRALVFEMQKTSPDIVIHMAAQPLVRDSYKIPVETYSVNVMGTVNLLEAVRVCDSVKAVINVTTDKCYENLGHIWGYREYDQLGGYDPYSSSKACSELVTAAYRSSFFNPGRHDSHKVAIASARAGNVIGGGDWATDRLIPDCVRALIKSEKIFIRNPYAVRPWQHVLEPLGGYLLLAQRLYEEGPAFAEGWNFGPDDKDVRPVEWIVKSFCQKWGEGSSYIIDGGEHPHEAGFLKLDCSKAKARLGWRPVWEIEKAVDRIVGWTRAYLEKQDLTNVCLEQVEEYVNARRGYEL